MKFVPALTLCLVLAGCNVQAKHDNDKNETVRISASDADGNVSFDLPFAKGEVKLPDGAVIHGSDVDIDGVKLYPGASVTGFNIDAKDKNSVVSIAFKTPAPADKVRAYFLDEFKKKGVTASASGDAVSGTSKDGSPFQIQVTGTGNESQGTIRLVDSDKD